MITCPRCGYQAPDGSPWCPNCGYGCPHPELLQQPTQQMPILYQPQQIPPQYDIYDIPPQQEPQKPPKMLKKKHNKLKRYAFVIFTFLGMMGFLIFLLSLMPDTDKQEATITPNIETMIAEINNQNATAEMVKVLSATPTRLPTNTSAPLLPSDTPIPAAAESAPVSDQTGATYRGSLPQAPTDKPCVVKGSKNGKYHCKNSPNYDTMKEYVCFSSEAEAIAAGYVMSGNQGGYCRQ